MKMSLKASETGDKTIYEFERSDGSVMNVIFKGTVEDDAEISEMTFRVFEKM